MWSPSERSQGFSRKKVLPEACIELESRTKTLTSSRTQTKKNFFSEIHGNTLFDQYHSHNTQGKPLLCTCRAYSQGSQFRRKSTDTLSRMRRRRTNVQIQCVTQCHFVCRFHFRAFWYWHSMSSWRRSFEGETTVASAPCHPILLIMHHLASV